MLVEQTKDYAIFVLGPDGRILTWGAGGQLIKGYTADEIVGQHFSIFYPDESVKAGWPDHELKMATAQGRFEDEGWRVRKNGSRFWASVVITALRNKDGKLIGFSKITRDLSERRMAEDALRQSEERFRLLVDGVSDYAIFMLDPDGIITSWNTGAERIKGYKREEIIGQHFSRFYSAEDVESGKPWEELAMARRTGHVEDEGWRYKQNGERFWARVVLTPLYDTSGQMRGFAKVTQDISERRHIADLERAAQNISEFISMLTHELRNPLAPIRGAISAISHMAVGDPRLHTMHQIIDRQSAHLSRILDDMMDVSRIARGKMTLVRAEVDLAEVIERAIETSRPPIEAGNHEIATVLPGEPIVVHGDVIRLAQLVSNLLNNSARYSPRGSHITVTARREGKCAVVSVKDTGRGIEPQNMERIFSMFIQGRTTSTQSGDGLGIGLALARNIAQLHGGTLHAFSEGTNRGSEFTLELPLTEGSDNAQLAGSAESAVPGVAPKRILIVDDNADAAQTLELMLASLGHETLTAYDGIAAVQRAVEFRPNIVLLDLGMPGIDGYETARRLRDLEHDNHLRIIAVSGWGQESDRQKTREAGFDLHLVKPVDVDQLLKAISNGAGTGQTLH